MKKSFIYVLSGALCILSACNKEIEKPEENQESSGEKKMITELVSVKSENDGNETKVAIDGSNTYQWTSNDYLAFFVTDDGGASYTKVTTESPINTETKEFTLSYPAGYTRGGYGVIPATFAKSLADGNLTVTYPDSYDISADIADGHYDNRGIYIPVPMVAVNSGDNMTFYSIGALVKVTMSNIPVGTKNVYVTFNQVVTGDFTVTDPGSEEPRAVITGGKASAPSTVSFHISDDGLDEKKTITLYIPVPTTTSSLKIASVPDNKAKASIARNYGYAFAADAIVMLGDGSIKTNHGTYVIAPGNLLGYKDPTSGVITYSFLSGTDQLITTKGKKSNDPHKNEGTSDVPVAAPTWGNRTADEPYKDVFTITELREIVGDGTDAFDLTDETLPNEQTYHFAKNTLNISEYDWKVPSKKIQMALMHDCTRSAQVEGNNNYRTGIKATVHGFPKANLARVRIDVTKSIYSEYALKDGKYIPGLLVFPDGYVDQTDMVSSVGYDYRDENNTRVAYFSHSRGYSSASPDIEDLHWNSTPIVTYENFAKMSAMGVTFMPAAGYNRYWKSGADYTDYPTGYFQRWETVGSVGLYLSDTMLSKTETYGSYNHGLNIGDTGTGLGGKRSMYYCSVRLVREVN